MITYALYFLYIFDISLSYPSNVNNSREFDESKEVIPRIYRGWAAKLGDVPYQISFKMRRGNTNLYASFCGGVIIGPQKLLSAAHCFAKDANFCDTLCSGSGPIYKKVLSHIAAVAGQLTNVARYPSHDGIEDGQWRHLEDVRYPAEYQFPKLDIAIVFLLSPFNFNNHVNAIPYASKFINYDGQCLASGFGRTSPSTLSDKLLLAHLTLVPWKWCEIMHRKRMRHFICTSSQLTDVGKGDSGGPLVCAGTGDPQEKDRGILVGIVSGNSMGVGSFFTRVSSYYNYIERNKSCNDNVFSIDFYIIFIILEIFIILIWFYFLINFRNLHQRFCKPMMVMTFVTMFFLFKII